MRAENVSWGRGKTVWLLLWRRDGGRVRVRLHENSTSEWKQRNMPRSTHRWLSTNAANRPKEGEEKCWSRAAFQVFSASTDPSRYDVSFKTSGDFDPLRFFSSGVTKSEVGAAVALIFLASLWPSSLAPPAASSVRLRLGLKKEVIIVAAAACVVCWVWAVLNLFGWHLGSCRYPVIASLRLLADEEGMVCCCHVEFCLASRAKWA